MDATGKKECNANCANVLCKLINTRGTHDGTHEREKNVDYLFLFQLKTINFVCNCRYFVIFLPSFQLRLPVPGIELYFPFSTRIFSVARCCWVFIFVVALLLLILFFVVNNIENTTKTINDNNISFSFHINISVILVYLLLHCVFTWSSIKYQWGFSHKICIKNQKTAQNPYKNTFLCVACCCWETLKLRNVATLFSTNSRSTWNWQASACSIDGLAARAVAFRATTPNCTYVHCTHRRIFGVRDGEKEQKHTQWETQPTSRCK